jgi:hypothetical protein
VDEQRFGHHLACRAQVCHGIGDAGRVPVDDRGDDQVQARCPVLLRRGAAVCDPTLLEGADDLLGLVVTAMPKVTLRKIRNFKTLPFILCRN